MALIYRQFPTVWSSAEWEPHIPVLQKGIFSSRFPGLDKTVFTFINRDSTDKQGNQLQLPYQEGTKYFDLWNGAELKPIKKDSTITLAFNVEALGYGAVVAIKEYSSKNWRFELFYWDYVIGILLFSLLSALTLGSFGNEGRSFLADIKQADIS